MGVFGRHAGRGHLAVVGLATGIAAIAAVVIASATAALAAFASRKILVPPTFREEDTRIVGVDYRAGTITFRRSPDAVIDGMLSFWFEAATGHARIGRIVSETEDTVTRRLIAVDFGELELAKRGRFNGWFYLYPSDLGTGYDNVVVETELGPAPAWKVPPSPDATGRHGGRWVIQVHGRAVMRAETIRAIPVFRDAGYTSLLISYRNDFEAPSSADGRYSLGDTEWRDVESAMEFAKNNGATSVVLMGWSMGGAAVLQAATRSHLAGLVAGIVLDSPVVDWVDTLDFQGRSMGLIRPLRLIVYRMMGAGWGRFFTGLRDPIDLRRLDFVERASELTVPILILHSDDDGYVPSTASRALARARPDIVTLETFHVARHTKLWNYDPERWTRAIRDWLSELEGVTLRSSRAPALSHGPGERSSRESAAG